MERPAVGVQCFGQLESAQGRTTSKRNLTAVLEKLTAVGFSWTSLPASATTNSTPTQNTPPHDPATCSPPPLPPAPTPPLKTLPPLPPPPPNHPHPHLNVLVHRVGKLGQRDLRPLRRRQRRERPVALPAALGRREARPQVLTLGEVLGVKLGRGGHRLRDWLFSCLADCVLRMLT